MPTLDVQQSFDDPQHHRSLVAVPSHGTMGELPTLFFVCWQTFRQPSDETSLLVQKSTHCMLLESSTNATGEQNVRMMSSQCHSRFLCSDTSRSGDIHLW